MMDLSVTRDTDRDWDQIAKTSPYWGVLSADEYHGLELHGEVRRRFFETGNQYVSDLLGFIGAHFPAMKLERVLDFGCGVGRLTIPFAQHATEVMGLDVSQKMLEICQRNAEEFGARNIVCAISDDELTAASGMFDLVNSTIVLQHIDPPRGLKLFERLLLKLRPGGAFAIQLTYARARKFLMHEEPYARYYRRSGASLIDVLVSGYKYPEGTISMFDYDLNEVLALSQSYAGSPIALLPTRDNDHLGVQIIGLRSQSG